MGVKKYVIKTLFVFFGLLVFASACAQVNCDTCLRKMTWGVGIGLAENFIDGEVSSPVDWGRAFPSLGLPNQDYNSWGSDKHAAIEPDYTLPVALLGEIAFPFSRSKSAWIRNTECRAALSFGYSTAYEGNIEKITGDVAKGGLFSRELYLVRAHASAWAARGYLMHNTRYYGSFHIRLGYGLGMVYSTARLNSTLSHVAGTYISSGEGNKTHWWYQYPVAETLNHEFGLVGHGRGWIHGLGYEIPLSVEVLTGAKRKFHNGFQLNIGKIFSAPVNGSSFAMMTLTACLTFRFDIY